MKWPLVRLDECARIVGGATPSTSVPSYWDGDISWVTPKDLSDLEGTHISQTPRKITESGLASCAAEILPSGSVLFSSRAPIGHVAITTAPMATNQGFKSLVPDKRRAEAGYLYWWLRCHRTFMESLGNGATFKEVSKAVVARVEIPLPPLGEQRQIAEILYQADALRQRRKESEGMLARLSDGMFRQSFGDPRLEANRWSVVPFEQACADQTSRSSKLQRGEYQSEGKFPVVDQGQDFIAGWSDDDELLCRSSSPVIVFGDHTRKVKYVDFPFIVGADGAKVLAPSSLYNPLFFAYLLERMPIPNLGYSRHMREVKRLVYPCPPRELQDRFAMQVAGISQQIERNTAHARSLDALFASLQHRAFTGQLTRSDEGPLETA